MERINKSVIPEAMPEAWLSGIHFELFYQRQRLSHAKNAKLAKRDKIGRVKSRSLLFFASFAFLLVHHSSFSSLIWVFQTSDGGSDHAISVGAGVRQVLKWIPDNHASRDFRNDHPSPRLRVASCWFSPIRRYVPKEQSFPPRFTACHASGVISLIHRFERSFPLAPTRFFAQSFPLPRFTLNIEH